MNVMFIIRNSGQQPEGFDVKQRRRTPGEDRIDWFVLGDPEAARAAGHAVVLLHDGWYSDDTGGGVAIYGAYWEIRGTHFTVREVAPDPAPAAGRESDTAEITNVRRAIFGA
jgi:hypothetical protein